MDCKNHPSRALRRRCWAAPKSGVPGYFWWWGNTSWCTS